MCKRLLALALSVAMLTTAAQADDLLTIDLSVLNQVTITATSGLSAASALGSDTTGLYFENFFSADGVESGTFGTVLGTADLTNAENPSDGSPLLFRSATTDAGMNMWSWSTDLNVSFTAGSLAFTGSATWTVSPTEYTDMLSHNSSGNLYFPADSFDDLGNATLLGTYSVVPEPATLSLFALGLGLALLSRRR